MTSNSFLIAAWGRAVKCVKPLVLSVCICAVMLCVSVTLGPQAGAPGPGQGVVHESISKTVHAIVPEESFVSERKFAKVSTLPATKTADKPCEETYGFLPCSDSIGGSAFLVLIFGMILMYAAQCIGDGGEALLELEVMPPALIGGMLLPLLGAIPDAVIILVSGMGGTQADAQKKIAVGVGTLAGSTIMLLCIAFASSLFVARCDIGEDGEAVDETLNGEYYNSRAMGYCSKTQNMCGQLFSTGITYDHRILRIKRMMLFSSIGFLGVQIPALIWTDTDKIHTACLSMGVFSFICLVAYLVDNVIHESHTEHHEEATHLKRTFRRGTDMAAIMRSCSQMGVDQTKANKVHEIVDQETGAVIPEGVSDLFDAFDVDKSGFLDTKETERFIKMIVKFTGDGALPSDVSTQLALAMERSRAEIVEKSSPSLALCKPTKNRDNCINKDAFVSLMVDLLQQQLEAAKKATEDEENQETDEPEEAHISFWHAMGLIVLGTGLVTVFSDAMVDSIDSFGKQTGVPNFTMGFIICPYVSNASELLSSLQLAAHKKKKNASVAFAQIYAAVIMNNCICSGVFLMLVWARGLEWIYVIEVFSVVFVIWAISLVTCSQTTIRLWVGLVACIMYPLALITVEVAHIYGIK